MGFYPEHLYPLLKQWIHRQTRSIVTEAGEQLLPRCNIPIVALVLFPPVRAMAVSNFNMVTVESVQACRARGLAGYDVALTRRRSGVRISSSPSFFQNEIIQIGILCPDIPFTRGPDTAYLNLSKKYCLFSGFWVHGSLKEKKADADS